MITIILLIVLEVLEGDPKAVKFEGSLFQERDSPDMNPEKSIWGTAPCPLQFTAGH